MTDTIKEVFAAMVLIAMLIAPVAALPEEKPAAVVELEAFIADWFGDVAPWRRDRAVKLVPTVVKVADRYNVDPLLVAVVIARESSWSINVIGKRGEVGLMQVHGVAAKGHNLSIADGQLEAGVSWLARCIDVCGSVEGGLARYQTGHSCDPIRGSKIRYKQYLEAIERWRK